MMEAVFKRTGDNTVETRQWVLPFAVSCLTPSIKANSSSTLMPLTTFGSAVSTFASMTSLLCILSG